MTEYAYEIITKGGPVSAKTQDESLQRIAGGATADVFLHQHDDSHKFALKLYRKPSTVDWDKLSYQVAHPIDDSYSIDDSTHPQFAWPLAILTSGGENAGIVMPYLDRAEHVTLDHWIEHHLREESMLLIMSFDPANQITNIMPITGESVTSEG